jgi:hypothetical protein
MSGWKLEDSATGRSATQKATGGAAWVSAIGAVASDGVALDVDSLAQTLGYIGSQLTTVTVAQGGVTYIQTLTYTGSNLTGVSKWVKQ